VCKAVQQQWCKRRPVGSSGTLGELMPEENELVSKKENPIVEDIIEEP